MSELNKYDFGIPSIVEFDRSQQELLGKGIREGTVHSLRIDVIGKNGKVRTIPLAEKIFDQIDADKISIEDILATHSKLKKAKISTIPTMRFNREEPRKLYLTDLTEGGKNEVFSMSDWSESMFSTRVGKFASEKGYEKRFEISNMAGFEDQLVEIFTKACEAGSVIPWDAFFVIVDKETKQARVIVGDISDITFADVEFKDIDGVPWVYNKNASTFSGFLDGLEQVIIPDHDFDRSKLKDAYNLLRYPVLEEPK